MFLLASSSCWPVYWKHVKGVAGVQAYMLYSRGYNTMKRGWWWGVEVDHNGFYPLLSERINKSIPGVAFSNNSLGHRLCLQDCVWCRFFDFFSPPLFGPSGSPFQYCISPFTMLFYCGPSQCNLLPDFVLPTWIRFSRNPQTRTQTCNKHTQTVSIVVRTSVVKVTNRNVFIRNLN